MVVYHLNVFIGTVLCVPHSITNVTVALMFVILYPRQESNLQLTRLKLVVFTVSPRGYFDGKVGFEPTYSRDFPRTFHHKTSYQTFRKNWWLRNPSSVWVNLYHFSIFFERFPQSVLSEAAHAKLKDFFYTHSSNPELRVISLNQNVQRKETWIVHVLS